MVATKDKMPASKKITTQTGMNFFLSIIMTYLKNVN